MDRDSPVCVAGATGYVGGRLVPLLLERGLRVRAVARSAAKARQRPWGAHERLEIAEADLSDPVAVRAALAGCAAVFHLVHSMRPGCADYAAADRAVARNVADAARQGGVGRIVYLGGMVPAEGPVSGHLRSRAEVGEILAAGPVPVTVLRAAQILGSGSASFEIVRYLAERLPVMLTPRWVRTETQPIAVRDVLEYLAGCLDHPETAGHVYDIGGPDVLTYRRLFEIYAEEAGLGRRFILPVPLLTPRLSAHWVGLVTPVPAALARPLIAGLSSRVVCANQDIRKIVPVSPTPVRAAIRAALDRVRQQAAPTCWSDAGHARAPEWLTCGDAPYAGGTVLEYAAVAATDAAPEAVWAAVESIGGERGWYHADWLWRLRGLLDGFCGGVGLRRGRRDPRALRVDDALDFWRVLDVRREARAWRLALAAEMRLPGEALLEFLVRPEGAGARLDVRARFLPRGLAGLAYWQATRPFHAYVFPGLARGVVRRAGGRVLAAGAARQGAAEGPGGTSGGSGDGA
ncbi:MAG: DUF2867 domain-containing protein [Desulfovibrionaceae bacterium]|nr:DUF2867 domain-containing protein [Desulfovibrionaceae bacterium]